MARTSASTPNYDFKPDYATPPGALLDVLLEYLDLSQADLADRTGLSTKYVNQIIKKNVTVSAETAMRLETVTNVPAETWTRLEAEYRAEEARTERRRVLHEWVDWLNDFRLPELQQRGVISGYAKGSQTVDELLRFFGISSPENWDRVWQPSLTRFRRSPSFKPETAPTTVWLRIGQKKAAPIRTPKYDAGRLVELLPAICRLTVLEPSAALDALPALCIEAGVAVVYAAELKGCRASGATWWANPHKAVVVLSNRGKREDRFWFSLFHELGHLLRHAKRDTYLDQSGPDSDKPPWEETAPSSGFIDDGSRDSALEREADDFASQTLIPDAIVPRVKTATSKPQILEIAQELQISPGVVAGRRQFETGDYSKFNELRRLLPSEPFDAPPPTSSAD